MTARNDHVLTNPLVTVFMAAYNNGEYLKSAIDSVLRQTYTHFELIIVNDGSVDNSDEIISTYQDERIICVHNKLNLGIVRSRNLGLDIMKGKYLAVLDSDDLTLPDRLEKQVAFLEANPDYGLCGTYFNVISSEGEIMNTIRFPQENDDITAYLHLGNCFCHSSVMVRSNLVKKHRYSTDNVLGEDYHLFLDLKGETKFANLPFIGCYYRVHKKNVSYQMNAEMYSSIKAINRWNLSTINISFTERQLDIHSHFLIFNADFFKDDDEFEELEDWVKKLIAVTQSHPLLNRPIIFKFLLHRWFVICYKKGKLQKVLFSNLLFTYKLKYIAAMLTEAFAHSTNTYLRKVGRAAILSFK